jgi:release factor glutamine methyltransferase
MVGRPSIGCELREGARFLNKAGVFDSKREATELWASLAGTQPGDVWLTLDDEALEPLSMRFRELLRRRTDGEPLAYVIGDTGFRKLNLTVDPRALIPRPETEGLVEHVLEWCQHRFSSERANWGAAVDVGTGSGCIALSLAVEGNFERIIATDVSKSALELAAENLENVAPEVLVELRHGSLLETVDDIAANVLVSNPPYVTTAEYAMLDRSVKDFEPQNALVSGDDGLIHTREILKHATELLVSGGLIAIEVDCTRAEATRNIALQLGWSDVRIEADLFDRPRYLLATKEK